MPRNGSGVYSLPAGSVFVPQTTIESSKVNGINADIASDLNTARPIVAGGTGATTVSGAQANLGIDPKIFPVVKTANYTALLADNNTYFRFTTAATLSLTAAATLGNGWKCYVHAYGVDVIIDPNSAETINGKATIGVKSGDWAMVICDGTAFYTRPISPTSTPVVKTANYTALDVDNNKIFRFTSAATFAIDVTANLRDDWRVTVWNDSTGLITVDPDSTNTINGATTIVLQNGQRAKIFKTSATTFQANILSDSFSGPQLQGYYFGLGLTTNATDAANDIDIAVGSAAADVSPYYLMQLTSALTKRIDAAWAVGTNQGGLDTGSVANSTYYIWLIQRSDTGVVDALFSLSATAPTMPSNYDRKRLIGNLVRASATNSAPVAAMGIRLAPSKVTLSTAAVDITGIPANVKRVTILFESASTTGSSPITVQLGTSAGVDATSSYVGAQGNLSNGATAAAGLTNGFAFGPSYLATFSLSGAITLSLKGENVWVATGQIGSQGAGQTLFTSGAKTLAGMLDRVRVTTTGGTDTFDAGSINISWEF